VERLQGVVRDQRANWAQSIATLEAAKAAGVRVTKTSLMLGCGEAPHEVVAALRALRDAGARVLGSCACAAALLLSSPTAASSLFVHPLHEALRMQASHSLLCGVASCGACSVEQDSPCVCAASGSIHCMLASDEELDARADLGQPHAKSGVDVVTLGQYMRPTKRHMAVAEYVTPEAFAGFETAAKNMGFLYVAAGPLVRSSYRAGEFYLTNVLRGEEPEAKAAAV
jgi:lipoate synthase